MKIYAVRFWDNGVCEMCYPAQSAQEAIKLCEQDYPNSRYYIAEEVK